ncbi:AAA family ATPase [Neobacillus cucumis]|uniref:AAA family ATPase n=1 Tax=Neobacillus cucumis TaxID=1740721 RepID=UPI00203D722A|nr:AAA family ATPase [Neobacillus cucumis]MCM3729945.1 AAA family ATPase [Neobacillus cucumis]
MLIKKLTLENFRQYKGIHEIELLPKSSDKNVTVILGQNTSGKTTLLQAFNWVLFGKANFKTKDFLLNLELAQEMNIHQTYYVSVTLELIHNFLEFTIQRKQEYRSTRSGNVVEPKQAILKISYKDDDGRTIFVDETEHEETINKIIPEELMSYFFFDGERIENLGRNEKKGKEDLALAVKTVLGLEALNNAVIHLERGTVNSVIGQYTNNMDYEGNFELSEVKRSIDEYQVKLNENERILEDNNNSIEYFQHEKENLEGILKENQNVKTLQLERKQNESQINTLKRNNNDHATRIKKDFNSKAPFFFGKHLISKAMDVLKESNSFDKGIPHMHGDSIDFIVQRGQCLCGTIIRDGNEAYIHLKKEQSYLPPQSIGTLIQTFRKEASFFIDSSNGLYSDVSEEYKKIRQNKNDISRFTERNEKISSEIEIDTDIGEVEKKLANVKKKLKELEKERVEILADQKTLQKEMENLGKRRDELSLTDEKNKQINEYITYAREVAYKLSSTYKKKEEEIRLALEQNVNEIFNKMYHGNRSIKINSRYVYDLDTPNINSIYANKADESKGLEIVTSFSFICGIVKLARENSDNFDVDMTSESYPLVMDGPFSNADEKHVENIANIMPKVAEQVIIFVMHKDWKYAESVLANKMSNKYELVKQSETSTVLKEC